MSDDDDWAEYDDPDGDTPLPRCSECGRNWGHAPGCDVARLEASDWPL
ncbi:hypothetical protein OG455_41935 [Kitasatospora sp. NBC_01287]|nr:hypothetical protein [Kitasatospora sp. NBC_01287]MCX4752006.1 hypothetical protein [Kitasatospora sp. NBC_01287]